MRMLEVDRSDTKLLELLADVCHELGNPLMVIKSNLSSIHRYLLDHALWPRELDQREVDLEFAVERMLALREELLIATRSQVDQIELGPTNLSLCLERVCRMARLSAQEKALTFTEEYSSSRPYVIGNDWAVQSICSNLLSNAVRYTMEGSVHLKVLNKGPTVIVEVSDTGVGISEVEQTRIYERYYRTPMAQEMNAGGIGLGLAITRNLIEALGATIEVESYTGIGSTFRVAFSAAEYEEAG